MKNFFKNYWAIFIPIAVLVAALIFLLVNKSDKHTAENQIIGMVDAEFVDVSSSLPGKVALITVSTGEKVVAGQTLAQMETDKIETLKAQAADALIITQSQQNKVEEGTRPEVVASARNLERIAQEQMNLMSKTYSRFQNLYAQGVVSGQERDLVYFRYKAAQKELETARLNVQMLQKGSSQNAKNASSALTNQARNTDKLIRQIEESSIIKSPVSGTISTLVSKSGEMVNAGYPMMTVMKDRSYFVKFNIRQDLMSKVQKGKTVMLRIPGATPEKIEAVVTDLAPGLGYADWVPERQSGQIELRTFQIRAVPKNLNDNMNLRPGMTAELILD